jgi:hypothetical protein
MAARSKKHYKEKYGFKSFELTPGKPIRHIRLTEDMLASRAWMELSAYEIKLYIAIKRKYNGGNHDDISFTYAEGERQMAKRTFTKAMDKLIECGFVDLQRQGRYIREPNIYELSARWQRYGTKDFLKKERRKRETNQEI